MTTEKFMRRAQEFIGTSESVDRTVVVRERSAMPLLLGAAAFFALAILLSLVGITNVFLVGLTGAGVLAAVVISQVRHFYLVGVGSEVMMVRLSPWTGRPESLERTLARPLPVEPSSEGLLTNSVEIDSQTYDFSRFFQADLEALRTIVL